MNRIISALFCLFLLLASVSAGSADSRWVTCEGRAEVANVTAAEAVQIALTDARRNAIETVAGVRLASASIVQDFTLLSDVVNSASYGQIVAEKVVQWDADVLQEDKTRPPVIIYKVKLRAQVARPEGEPDPAFKLEAKLNKRVFTTGEEMFVEARANRQCFITLINLTADSRAIVLVPSMVRAQSRLAKGDYFRFPTQSEQASGIHLKVGTLPGHRKDREAIMVVATKTRQPLPPKIDDTPYYTSDAVGSWLVDIPLSERTINVLPYEIVGE
ncbi:MAG: DUF4384 domain-containing protein [Desulfobacteraceae bacterium]|nr:DUF4384 domain-containing protein [Pseudomonadota bacterium]MBU4257992.1 DUF4384 domain-containing protein [Pseudomonadota bacterium]MCG2759227.1 DUF4384 domain-containing protein [Desulfobacteraceae bacterium]